MLLLRHGPLTLKLGTIWKQMRIVSLRVMVFGGVLCVPQSSYLNPSLCGGGGLLWRNICSMQMKVEKGQRVVLLAVL